MICFYQRNKLYSEAKIYTTNLCYVLMNQKYNWNYIKEFPLKKILLIMNDAASFHYANGKIIKHILPYIADGYKVDIVSNSDEISTFYNSENTKNIKLYTIKTRKWELLNKTKLLSIIYKFIFWPDINSIQLNAYLSKVKTLLSENSYEGIITSSGVSWPILVLLKLKKQYKDIHWVCYLNDPLPPDNHTYKNKLNLLSSIRKSNKKVFQTADKIILTEDLQNYYSLEIPSNKGEVLNIPLINTSVYQNNNFMCRKYSDIKNIVYAGSIDRKIRNPEYTLKLMEELVSQSSWELTLYGVNEEKNEKSPFIYKGSVSQNELINVYQNADVLLSIGNNSDYQIPSKIFDYISSGKPIIHTIKMNSDPVLKYLHKYGNYLIIDERESLEENLIRLNNFLIENLNRTIAYDEINKTFYKNTPIYAANVIKSMISLKK